MVPYKHVVNSVSTPRFEQLPITYSGGLRDDSRGAHAFYFMRRKGWAVPFVFGSLFCAGVIADVPSSMRAKIAVEGRGLHRYPESANDVVCAVKRYASDNALSQDGGFDVAGFSR